MRRVGFDSTTPVFERVKTVHAFDGATTVIGQSKYKHFKCFTLCCWRFNDVVITLMTEF
jgi:hypothetical protein